MMMPRPILKTASASIALGSLINRITPANLQVLWPFYNPDLIKITWLVFRSGQYFRASITI